MSVGIVPGSPGETSAQWRQHVCRQSDLVRRAGDVGIRPHREVDFIQKFPLDNHADLRYTVIVHD